MTTIRRWTTRDFSKDNQQESSSALHELGDWKNLIPNPMILYRSSHEINNYLVWAKLYSMNRTIGIANVLGNFLKYVNISQKPILQKPLRETIILTVMTNF